MVGLKKTLTRYLNAQEVSMNSDLNQQWLDDDLPIAFSTVEKHEEKEVLENIPAPKHKLHDDFD